MYNLAIKYHRHVSVHKESRCVLDEEIRRDGDTLLVEGKEILF